VVCACLGGGREFACFRGKGGKNDVSSKISTGDVRVGSSWSGGVWKFPRPCGRQFEKGVRDRDGESQLDAAQHSNQPPADLSESSCAVRQQPGEWYVRHQRPVAYAKGYINSGPGIHPSEPNYIWAEAGTNLGVNNDDDPYHTDCSPDTVRTTTQHLSTFLTINKKTWKSYQEDTDVDLTNNTPLPVSSWTVPLFSHSGVFTSSPGVNAYNYSKQYNYGPSIIRWCSSPIRTEDAIQPPRIC
jgi:hypothetical protein